MAHAIKSLLTYFDAAFEQKVGVRYPISPAKDTAIAKRLLGLYTADQLQGWIDAFFDTDDPFIQQSGYSFGVFSACLSKVIVMSANLREQKRNQGNQWIQSIMRERQEP
jgi:hypothetical protein